MVSVSSTPVRAGVGARRLNAGGDEHARRDAPPVPFRRIDRGTVIAVALSVVFALLVLLQMLPGSTPVLADALGSEPHPGDLVTLPVFVAGAIATLAVIGSILVRAAVKREDEPPA